MMGMEVPASADMEQDHAATHHHLFVSELQKLATVKAPSKLSHNKGMSITQKVLQNKAERLAREKAEAAKREERKQLREKLGSSSEEEKEADQVIMPEPGADGVDEDPEPPNTDEALFQVKGPADPGSAASSMIILPPNAELDSASSLGYLLEVQNLFVAHQGPRQETLQSLFQLVTSAQLPLQAEQACGQLLSHYEALTPGQETHACWVPTLQELVGALHNLGCKSGTSSAGSPPATGRRGRAAPAQQQSAQKARDAASSTPLEGLPAAPQPGEEQATGQQEEGADASKAAQAAASRKKSDHARAAGLVQQVLVLVARLSAAHRAQKVDLQFSCGNMAAGAQLMICLMELHLVPSLRPLLLIELSAALEQLAEAWAATNRPTWDQVVNQVAANAGNLGPSYRAALSVLHELPASCVPLQQLRQACALQVMRQLAGKAAVNTSRRGSSDCSADATAMLQAMTAKGPRQLLQDVRLEGTDNPDFHKLIGLLDCAHLVVWPLVFGLDEDQDAVDSDHLKLAHDLQAVLKIIDLAVKGRHNATAARLTVLISGLYNLYAFNIPGADM